MAEIRGSTKIICLIFLGGLFFSPLRAGGGAIPPEPGCRDDSRGIYPERTDLQERTFLFDGLVRRFYFNHVSRKSADHDSVVIIWLHGGGGNGFDFLKNINPFGITGNRDRAGRRIFHVFPDGTADDPEPAGGSQKLSWNASHCCGIPFKRNVDDVAFIASVVDRLIWEMKMNGLHLFVAGYSNGGMLAYRIAAETTADGYGSSFRGFAVVAATIGGAPVAGGTVRYSDPAGHSAGLVSLFAIHGMKDPVVPYEGGSGTESRFDISFEESTAVWRKHLQAETILWILDNGYKHEEMLAFSQAILSGKPQTGLLLKRAVYEGGHSWHSLGGRKLTRDILVFFQRILFAQKQTS